MTATASPLACTFRFRHPKAERKTCGLPVLVERTGLEPLCPWHDPEARPIGFNVKQELEKELQSPNHWLEGAKLAAEDLRNLSACDGRLPSADLEGARLENALLHKAILDDAILISANMTAATLGCASLIGAKLDLAQLPSADLKYCDLSGARLHGTNLDRASLYGIKLNSETVFLGVVWGDSGEMVYQQFEKAASVFRTVRVHYRSLSNLRHAEDFYYREMTALHLLAINATFDPNDSWLRRWSRLRPPKWIGWTRHRWVWSYGVRPLRTIWWLLSVWLGWTLHRWVWGYGVRPFRTIGWMAGVVSLFGLLIYPSIGIREGDAVTSDWGSGLALSIVTFATLGYGNRIPCGTFGELLGGMEAILGALLMSVFIVGLATRHIHVS